MRTTTASSSAAAMERRARAALSELVGREDADWRLRRLGDGGQACAFEAFRGDGRRAWLWHERLVVKVYRRADPRAICAALDERDALARLHERLDGRTMGAWTIRCPQPLLLTPEPPVALVMTPVPGRSLVAHLRSKQDLVDLDSLASAVAEALETYWTGEPRLYGDLNLSNILCDAAERTIAFIDAGMPDPAFRCDGVADDFAPMSRDLAYLLYSAAVSVRANLVHPSARRGQIDLAERIVRAAMDRVSSGAGRRALLGEIAACAHVHLAMINTHRGPGWMWRRLVQRLAVRSMAHALCRLALPSEPDEIGLSSTPWVADERVDVQPADDSILPLGLRRPASPSS